MRNQQSQTTTVTGYPYVTAESASDAVFKVLALSPAADLVRVESIAARPEPNNQALRTLLDGKLAGDYGPVFSNGVTRGAYKLNLAQPTSIDSIGTWSFHQNGNRGTQHFTLFGSNSKEDPGWQLGHRGKLQPIATVRSACTGKFHATRIHRVSERIGEYHWLLWAVSPVTGKGENSAFQEFQITPSR
jgi:hypothetical protein